MGEVELRLAELYTVYFNRAPDADGLKYWVDEVKKGVMNYDAIAKNWAEEQTEFKKVYGDKLDIDKLINSAYEDVLNRKPDDDGFSYWKAELEHHHISPDTFLLAIINGAKAPTGSPDDAALINNKATAGIKVAEKGINDIEFAKKAIEPITKDPKTVSIVEHITEIAKDDNKALEEAKDTLTKVAELVKSDISEIDKTLTKLETIVSEIVNDKEEGKLSDTTEILTALTATVDAAKVDPTFIDNPETIADKLVSDPQTVEEEAKKIAEEGNAEDGNTEDGNTEDGNTEDGTIEVEEGTGDESSDNTPESTESTESTPESTESTDTTAPTVSSVAITGATGIQNKYLNAGDTVEVTVTMSESVQVSGTPQLALNIGGTTVQADYDSGSGSNALKFKYTIQAGENDSDGISIAANALSLNGGTIKDSAGNDAVLTFSAVADNGDYMVDTTAPNTTISDIAISDDTGSSSNDFITKTADQTITATLSANLATDEKLYGSVDGGNSWTDITNKVSNASISWDNVTLQNGSNSIKLKVSDEAGNDGTIASQDYTLDTTAPTTTISSIAISNDTGPSNSDFITNTANQTITATLSANLATDEKLYGSVDGGNNWSDITDKVLNTSISWDGVTLQDGSSSIKLKITDKAGNDGTIASQDYTLDTTAPSIISGPTLSDIDKISLIANDNVKAGIKDSNHNWIGNTPELTANTEGTIILSPLQNVANGRVAIDDVAGNLVESDTYVALGTNEDDTITASDNGDIMMGFDGNDNITGGSGDDLIEGGAGNDIIDEGSSGGNNVIRGGAGVDTITGGSGNDTFVVLGVINEDDYIAADVGQDTGAYKLGLTNLIDAGLDTSDTDDGNGHTDGSGETYNGGGGTNILEIWGQADVSQATLHNVVTVRPHSEVTISANQLSTLLTDNSQPLNLELMDDNSKVTITGLDSDMGLKLLKYLTPDMSNLSGSTNPPSAEIVFTFDADGIDDNNPNNIINETTYSIKFSDFLTNVSHSLDDPTGENSLIIADNDNDGINANDGNDIIAMQAFLTKDDSIDGGDGTDILLFTDTSGNTDILNGVTNVEMISIGDANGTSITTVDNLVAANKTLIVDASNISSGNSFRWDGSNETDGQFNIEGGDENDTIIGGDMNDIIKISGGTNTITGGGGADTIILGTGTDTVIISAGESTSNGIDTIKNFILGDGTANNGEDTLDLEGNASVKSNTTGTDGQDSGDIKSHAINNGIITFDDNDTYDGNSIVTPNPDNINSIISYLASNFTSGDNNVVAFAYDSDGNGTTDSTVVYQDNSNDASTDSAILLIGVVATSIDTADNADGALVIV